MIRKFIEWWKDNSKWYRSEYRQVWLVCQFICWAGVFLIVGSSLYSNIIGGLVIESSTENFIKSVLIGDVIILLVLETVSLTIYLVDLHEQKIGKA